MLYLSQRDPKWSQNKLGTSSLTIGRFGCTTTALSMMSSYFGCFYTPEEISRKYEWYTSDGLIIWDKLFFPCVKFMIRDYRYSPELVKKAIKDPKQAVLLQVNDGQHWVIGAKYNLFGRLMAVDPWDGKLCDVLSKYRNITGAAYFKSK